MKIIFLDFKEIQRDNGYDGITYLFNYKLLIPQPGAKINVEAEHKIETSIVRTLVQIWNYEKDELVKVLSEFAKQAIIQRLIQGKLDDYESLELHTNNVGKEKIFDPDKIEYPKNRVIEIHIESLKHQIVQSEKEKRQIGFKSYE